jgi:hypothetical protein
MYLAIQKTILGINHLTFRGGLCYVPSPSSQKCIFHAKENTQICCENLQIIFFASIMSR